VFTAVHSIEEEPDSAPAASPRLRRRPSARPPRSGFTNPEEFSTITAVETRHSRPRSARFEPV
jgi:hypothetical protein